MATPHLRREFTGDASDCSRISRLWPLPTYDIRQHPCLWRPHHPHRTRNPVLFRHCHCRHVFVRVSVPDTSIHQSARFVGEGRASDHRCGFPHNRCSTQSTGDHLMPNPPHYASFTVQVGRLALFSPPISTRRRRRFAYSIAGSSTQTMGEHSVKDPSRNSSLPLGPEVKPPRPFLPSTTTNHPGSSCSSRNGPMVDAERSRHISDRQHERRPVRIVDPQKHHRPGSTRRRCPTCWHSSVV